MYNPTTAQNPVRLRSWRAIVAAGAAAVTLTAVAEQPVANWYEGQQQEQRLHDLMHKDGLINEFSDGVAPKELQGQKLGTITLGQDELAGSAVREVGAYDPQVLQGQVLDQTHQGAAGETAVVNLSDIDMSKADLTPPNPVTGLPGIIPEQQ